MFLVKVRNNKDVTDSAIATLPGLVASIPLGPYSVTPVDISRAVSYGPNASVG